MYIASIPNRNSPPAILLRESFRQDGKVKTRTIANLSKLPPHAIQALRLALKGHTLVDPHQAFDITASLQHGHVQAVHLAMKRLRIPALIASRSSPERDLVLAAIVSRILQPDSKLATTRWWKLTTIPDVFGVHDANQDDLYHAMDWLVSRQSDIEKRLAARHLDEDSMVFYDLSSSYVEGSTCSLAVLGHNRDGKKGKLQINFGLLANRGGCPISVSVFKGNTADPTTVLEQVEKLRSDFGLGRMILVGDRGMITQKQIDSLRDMEGIEWITALRSDGIKKLIEGECFQMGLFDERNLFELKHPDYPGERLIACRNPELATRRAHKRASLLEATHQELAKVKQQVEGDRLRGKRRIAKRVRGVLSKYQIGKLYQLDVREDGFDCRLDERVLQAYAATYGKDDPARIQKRLTLYQGHAKKLETQLEKVHQRITRGRLYGKDQIGLRVGKVLNKYKVGKHFKLEIQDDRFEFSLEEDNIAAEAALDGIYVVRTSLPKIRLDADETVRSYKQLSQVERAFRSFKTVDLKVRPIHHRLENRVRAHIFICMLAYYVQWHLMEAWRPLLFADEDHQAKEKRDPVAAAKRSKAAQKKASTKVLEDGSEAHSFQTLLSSLGGIVRNECRVGKKSPETFELVTTPNATQQKALDLVKTISL